MTTGYWLHTARSRRVLFQESIPASHRTNNQARNELYENYIFE
jgi:hypothetical protein